MVRRNAMDASWPTAISGFHTYRCTKIEYRSGYYTSDGPHADYYVCRDGFTHLPTAAGTHHRVTEGQSRRNGTVAADLNATLRDAWAGQGEIPDELRQ